MHQFTVLLKLEDTYEAGVNVAVTRHFTVLLKFEDTYEAGVAVTCHLHF